MNNGNILVGYENEDIREIIVMMLESEFDYSVKEVNSGQVAISELKEDELLKVLISDIQLKDICGEQVYLANRDHKNLPFVFITKQDLSGVSELSRFNDDNKNNAKLDMPFDHEEFIEVISKALLSLSTHDSSDMAAIPLSQGSKYYRIKIKRFLKFKKAFSNTYIKLSEDKYIKVLNIDELVEHEKFERYLTKGLEFLYLDKQQFNDYLDNRVNALMDKLDQKNLESSEAVSLHLESLQQVQEVAMSVGVKKQIIDLADKLTGNVIDTIKKNKNLKDFLSPTSSGMGYQFEHSNLVNYLVCGIANHLSSLSTDITGQKLIQASIFCDIGLPEDRLMQIISMASDKYIALPQEQKKLVQQHMQEGAKAIGNTNHPMADEIERIILAHHELPDGAGFPKGLTNQQIPLLSAAFILAYNFANQIIMGGKKSNIQIDKIFSAMGASYSQGNFASPYKALKDALK